MRKFVTLFAGEGPGKHCCFPRLRGHADEGLVALGRVRDIDRVGNSEADAAASLGRRRVHHFYFFR